jgi:hypothetical protein
LGEAKRRREVEAQLLKRWPENLNSLHEAEEDLRTKGLMVLCESGDLLEQVKLVESSMDLLQYYLQAHVPKDEDEQTIQYLGIRVFNGAAATLKLGLAGYGQAAAAIERDLLETVFLLNMFASNPERIAAWPTVDEEKRNAEFGPRKVREFLDQRDGFVDKRRKAAYDALSRVGSHPTVRGFALLRPGNESPPPGPFITSPLLAAVTNELARVMAQAGEVFLKFVKNDTTGALKAKADFMEVAGLWLERYFEEPHDAGAVASLRKLAAEIEQGAGNAHP